MITITRKQLLIAAEESRKLHERMDDGFDRANKECEYVIRCKKGCHDCCCLFVDATYVEALSIAEYLMSHKKFPVASILAERATAMFSYGRAEGDWFARQEPCVFLHKGLCTIYPVRPANCRYHAVISDPEDCSPRRPGAKVGRIDKFEFLNYTLGYQLGFQQHYQMSYTGPMIAPLPMIVLQAMTDLAKGGEKVMLQRVARDHGVPSLDDWLKQMKDVYYMGEHVGRREDVALHDAAAAAVLLPGVRRKT